MKKISLVVFSICISSFAALAQLTPEFTYTPVSADHDNLAFTSYVAGEKKLAFMDSTTVKIYNSNYSLYKTITLPATPAGYQIATKSDKYIVTDKLFNSDDKIEVILYYEHTTNYTLNLFKIVNEDGTVLLSEDSLSIHIEKFEIIKSTDAGYKMVLGFKNSSDSKTSSFKVYGLNDELTTGISIAGTEGQSFLRAFPNPVPDGKFEISYRLPSNLSEGRLIIRDFGGIIKLDEKVGNDFDKILIDASEFNSGIYICTLTDEKGVAIHSSKVIIM